MITSRGIYIYIHCIRMFVKMGCAFENYFGTDYVAT